MNTNCSADAASKSVAPNDFGVPYPFKGLMHGRVTILHVAIVMLSLLMTLGAWKFTREQIDTKVEARFAAMRDQTVGLIRNGMRQYEDALWAGVAAVGSHGNDMTLTQWRDFSETLRIDEKYPGINGIGIIHFVDREALPSYLARRQAERPSFTIYPPHTHPVLMPISFIEPERINTQAIGLDVAHEVNRRTAAQASGDTGIAQITGPITLVQDAGNTPGFLFYAPFYAESGKAQSGAAAGAVYAPFVVRKLMAGLLAKEARDVRFSISDAGETIYDEHEANDPLADPSPLMQDQVSLDLYGRTWLVDLRSTLVFRTQNTYAQPVVVLIGGLIIEALIIGMLFMMGRANQNAVAYADKVTADLVAEKHKLDLTNQELEQFAYVASHDLKTPIRGISGLTEMLREDLEDYFASPEAISDVADNLNRIDARVAHMNELTRGIMEFSRVGDFELVHEPLFLEETIEGLVSDFRLRPEQVVLNSDVEVVFVDTFNLRRVLENLVGNASKYHDGVKPLRIVINVTQRDDRLHFHIADNGPGIDPQFHDRIFEVFQTLRAADAPESTGIGLAIVKKIVERQRGKVTLTSSKGAGAQFNFDWPVSALERNSSDLDEAA